MSHVSTPSTILPENSYNRETYQKQWRKDNRGYLNAYMRDWHKRNPNYNRERTRKAREEILAHYGKSCACCGESRFEFLCLDHINGGGRKHRESIGSNNVSLCAWLKKNNWPTGFQTLCGNCNSSLGYYGYCPHHPEIRREI